MKYIQFKVNKIKYIKIALDSIVLYYVENRDIVNNYYISTLYIIMRHIKLLIILLSINSFSQSTIQLVSENDSLSKRSIYVNIYKNQNTRVTRSGSNKDGFISLKIDEVDSTATYHFNFRSSKFKPIWQKLDLNNNDTLKVELSYDEYYTLRTKDLYAGSYGYISFLNYYPRQPRRLNEIPKKIADSVTKYLKNRVGELFYSDFKLIDGQIVDLEELNRMYSYWRNSKTSYYLFFSYRNIQAGIKTYVSKIELDKNGNIVKDIDFPKVEKKSIQENIISSINMKDIVNASGFYKEGKTKIELSFIPKNNILVWNFINEYYIGNGEFMGEKKIYNAHNREYIETVKYTFEEIE